MFTLNTIYDLYRLNTLPCFQGFSDVTNCVPYEICHIHMNSVNVFIHFFKIHTLNLEWQWIRSKH